MLKITTTIIPVTALGIFLIFATVCAAGPAAISPESAANIARNCFSCHGPGGKNPGAIPALRGASAEFIASALKQFRAGERASTMMGRHARAYSDAQIKAVASYIARMK